MAKDEKQIFPLTPRCSADELREKLNEVINYLNGCIRVGLFPLPDEHKEDEKSGWHWPGYQREPAEGQGDFRDNCDDEHRNAI